MTCIDSLLTSFALANLCTIMKTFDMYKLANHDIKHSNSEFYRRECLSIDVISHYSEANSTIQEKEKQHSTRRIKQHSTSKLKHSFYTKLHISYAYQTAYHPAYIVTFTLIHSNNIHRFTHSPLNDMHRIHFSHARIHFEIHK